MLKARQFMPSVQVVEKIKVVFFCFTGIALPVLVTYFRYLYILILCFKFLF